MLGGGYRNVITETLHEMFIEDQFKTDGDYLIIQDKTLKVVTVKNKKIINILYRKRLSQKVRFPEVKYVN